MTITSSPSLPPSPKTGTTRKISDIKVGPRFRKDLGDIDTLGKGFRYDYRTSLLRR